MRKLEPSRTAVSMPWGTAIPETTRQYLVGKKTLHFNIWIVAHLLSANMGQNFNQGTSLAVQWSGLRLPMQGVQVRSLVGELRSHMPQNMERKQCCDKFNKDFKNGPHQIKSLKKKNKKKLQSENKRKKRRPCTVNNTHHRTSPIQDNKVEGWVLIKAFILKSAVLAPTGWEPSTGPKAREDRNTLMTCLFCVCVCVPTHIFIHTLSIYIRMHTHIYSLRKIF